MSVSMRVNESSQRPVVEMRAISKAFGHVQALDRVNFEVYPGEIVALVGDNGAGKSTLVKILCGVYREDVGEILIDGEVVEIDEPSVAQSLGIATVFQELELVDNRDVAANIYLGIEPMRGFFIDFKKMHVDAKAVLSTLHIEMPSTELPVALLSGGQRQAVAIARALVRGGRVLLLDEPTASLGVEQTGEVNRLVENLKQQGLGVVFISHNLAHVCDVADRVIVLRHGRRVGTRTVQESSPDEILRLITGVTRGEVC